MSSRSITYQPDFETRAAQGGAASVARGLAAHVRPARAYGIWHDIRMLESRAYTHPRAAARPWSLSGWLVGVAARAARAIAVEVRIRRDTRELMAMSDEILNDIGLTRGQISGALRYGRD